MYNCKLLGQGFSYRILSKKKMTQILLLMQFFTVILLKGPYIYNNSSYLIDPFNKLILKACRGYQLKQ